MHDKVNVIKQDPVTLTAALNGIGHDAKFLLELVLNFVGNRDRLTVIGSRGDQKEVGQAGVDGVEFENAGVFAFFIFAGRGSGLNEYAGLFVLQG